MLKLIESTTHTDDSQNSKDRCKEWGISALLYASVLTGPVIACTCATFVCLIPVSNVMEEPEFWYEDQITQFFAVIPLFVGVRSLGHSHLLDQIQGGEKVVFIHLDF